MIVLTEQELVELTNKVRPSAQKRVLEALGIPAKPRGPRDPSLVVYRIHVATPAPAGARLPSPAPVLQP